MKPGSISASTLTALLLTFCSLLSSQTTKKPATVIIEVSDGHGSPIPDAQVEIISVASAKTVKTDQMASARFELEEGDYDVILTCLAFKTLHTRITVKPGESQKFEFALRVGGCPSPDPCPVFPAPPEIKDLVPLTIVAVDPSGAAVPDVQIRLLPDSLVKAPTDPKTNERGELSVDLLPGSYYLFAAVPLFLPLAERIQVQAAPNQVVQVLLRLPELTRTVRVGGPNFPVQTNLPAPKLPSPPVATASLTIIVMNSTGVALPHAQIGGFQKEAAWSFPETDEYGRFNVKVVQGSYELVVTNPGFLRWTKDIQLQEGENRTVRVLLNEADFPR